MYRIILTLGTLLCLSIPAAAQPPAADPGQKTVRVVRTATAPTIDGQLDDAVWANAAVVDDLHQTEPVEYAEPFERTEIYILYDDDALYIGARLYDTDPELITANNMRQNDSVGQDDRFYVTIDPFNDRRSGYFFGVNPNGVRMDGIYRNISEFYSDWDSIFYAASGRFEGGWTTEIEIPFKSISFDPNTDTWGLNFSRGVVRKDENLAWVSRNRQYNPAVSGLAVGFEGLQQGVGLDIIPSASAIRSKNFSRNPLIADSSGSDFEPSLDVVYKLTPQLNASLTLNTDFSATEVDDRQVNLDRFGLFFPEKRDFFLREADIFEFGGIGGQRGSFIPGLQALQQNGRPFFSRRIGLSSTGAPVDIEAGGKISGRIGNFELGALSVRQDAYAGTAADNLSVVRAKAGVLEESNIGFIYTEGNPGANLENSLAGVDFQYRNTRLPGGRALEADLWIQQSETENVGTDEGAFGLSLRLPTTVGFRGGIEYGEYESNFNPALGFVNRRNVSDTWGNLGFMRRINGSFLQSWLINLDVRQLDYLDTGELQTRAIFFRPMVLRNRVGDQVTIAYQKTIEGLIRPFEISSGVIIPTARYDLVNWGLQMNLANHRKVSGTIRLVDYGDTDFFGGNRNDTYVQLNWRPTVRFSTSLSYQYSDIDLPQGRFETRLVSAGIDYAFSSTLSLVNLVQYDNVSETAGINIRLHWIPQAGRELYFVINHNAEDFDRDNSFRSISSDITTKINYTFRF